MWYGAKRDAVRGPGWVLMCRGIDEAVCEALLLYMKNVLGSDVSSPCNDGCGSCDTAARTSPCRSLGSVGDV